MRWYSSMEKNESCTRSPGILKKSKPGKKAGMRWIHSGCRPRLYVDIVSRLSLASSCGLLRRLVMFSSDRFWQFLRKSWVMFSGQWNVSMGVSIVPLSCRDSRLSGHVADGGSWVMRMDRGERNVVSRFMERIDLIMLLRDKGSWIRERSR